LFLDSYLLYLITYITYLLTLLTYILYWLTHSLAYLLTYLFHAAVLLEKLTSSQLVKKFPAFYGIRCRQLSLSRAQKIQSMPSNPTSWISILIVSSHLRLRFLYRDLKITTTRFVFSHLQYWHICINYNIIPHFFVSLLSVDYITILFL
jgi:hypothetical protein